MMPDNDQGRRSTVITFNLKILVIVTATVAVTFLFIRSNQTMINTPALVKTVYNTNDAGLSANNSENRLVLTAVNLTIDTNNTKNIVTDNPLSQKHDGLLKNDEQMFLSLAKQQILNTNVQDIKEFRSRKPELIQDDYFIVKPTSYRTKLNRYMTDTKIDKSMSINVDDNKSEVTVKNGMYQMDTEGSNSLNHEYSTIDAKIPLSDENDLNSHYSGNDSSYNSYNSGSYTYKEIEIPVDEIKLVTDGQTEQINTMDDLLQIGSGSYDYRPHSYYHDFKARYPTGQAYKPLASIPMKNRQPSKHVPDEENHKPISKQSSKISFKNNIALLLIKLGILKLKMIGILQIVFLLVFKLKLFIITIFTKFLLLMKLKKFFKIIMMPVILLSSLSLLGTIINGKNNSLASSQSSLLSTLLLNLPNNMEESSSSGTSSSSSSSSSPAGSSSSSFSSYIIPGDIPPDLLELLLPSLSRESSSRIFLDKTCDSNNILLPDLSLGGTNQSKIEHPYFTSKVQDSNTFNKKPHKSFDPTLTISPKILDSEKCVQSIACRLAVAEKAGIIPIQIKLWILNGVSKLIPEEKYELYFKTYNFINNEIETTNSSLTTDNWSEWCLERYNSDNITNRLK